MSKMVICNHGADCGHESCAYGKPSYSSVMDSAMCGYINKFVDIHVIEELPEDNPNTKFRRIKHGL